MNTGRHPRKGDRHPREGDRHPHEGDRHPREGDRLRRDGDRHSREGGNPANRLSARLPGTWELVSRIDVTASGERHPDPALGEDPVALLIYDRSGHFAAQFMKRDRSVPIADGPPGAPNNSRAQGGYDAYFGTYDVDDDAGTVTQRLTAALSRENVGMVLTRAMSVDGDTLTIALQTRSTHGVVTRTLTWKRVG